MTAHEPTLRIEPGIASWALLLERDAPSAEALELREQLGLPTDRPLIMAGHQPMFWHPGVLAKYVAARAAAARCDARTAWLVVDHDLADAESTRIRFPTRVGGGRLAVAEWTISEADPTTPACVAPTHAPEAPVESPAAPHVADGLARIRESLLDARDARSLAEQIERAQRAMLARELGLAPDAVVFASALARTAMFAGLVDRMRRDPAACAWAYNRAVDAHPEARLARLVADNGAHELPLWIMPDGAGTRRAPATDQDLARVDPRRLAPRALLLTACARLGACDLFIHGVGGSRYDAATEDWIAGWLGEGLAPRALVTATVHLPLDAETLPDEAAVRRAVWLAHKARHDPALLGEAEAATRRARLVAAISQAKRLRSGEQARHFAELQDLLTMYRARRSADLAGLASEAERIAARAGDARILADRTWAWPLFPPRTIAELASKLDPAGV